MVSSRRRHKTGSAPSRFFFSHFFHSWKARLERRGAGLRARGWCAFIRAQVGIGHCSRPRGFTPRKWDSLRLSLCSTSSPALTWAATGRHTFPATKPVLNRLTRGNRRLPRSTLPGVTCHPSTRCAAAPDFHVTPGAYFRRAGRRPSLSESVSALAGRMAASRSSTSSRNSAAIFARWTPNVPRISPRAL